MVALLVENSESAAFFISIIDFSQRRRWAAKSEASFIIVSFRMFDVAWKFLPWRPVAWRTLKVGKGGGVFKHTNEPRGIVYKS